MQLIDGARQWWRLHSNKLALLAGTLAAIAAENRQTVIELIDRLPDGARPVAVFLLVSVPPIVVRLAKQKDKSNG